jgi:hypothetical protein
MVLENCFNGLRLELRYHIFLKKTVYNVMHYKY